ncbi:MAG: serine/threonine-protein kinase [Candidatus Eremiobacteraeota bacterium]|nr:serine/threonine-protein kinase [Candidatus Eremiobacteraeota bacterium]
MRERVPAPDGAKDKDHNLLLVLPEGTLLKEIYHVQYFTRGGMSICYRGQRDEKKYLLKEVDAADTMRVLSLSQEKSMLERLSHPGIVAFVDFFQEEGHCYLVTEFIEGQSLDKLVTPLDKLGTATSAVFLNEKVALDWADQLYDIFEYLHRQTPPIIYKDLKPHNIIKDNAGRIHLVDFGIARVYKNFRTEDTLLMGSIITASPEHYGGKQTDERSDIFTIGATLHYLLTNASHQGSFTFEFEPVRAVNPAVSENTEEVIMKALAPDPEKRHQSIDAMRRSHRGSDKSPPPLYEVVKVKRGGRKEPDKEKKAESGSGRKKERRSLIALVAALIFAAVFLLMPLMKPIVDPAPGWVRESVPYEYLQRPSGNKPFFYCFKEQGSKKEKFCYFVRLEKREGNTLSSALAAVKNDIMKSLGKIEKEELMPGRDGKSSVYAFTVKVNRVTPNLAFGRRYDFRCMLYLSPKERIPYVCSWIVEHPESLKGDEKGITSFFDKARKNIDLYGDY